MVPALGPSTTRSDPGLYDVLVGTRSVRMTFAAASCDDGAAPGTPLRTISV